VAQRNENEHANADFKLKQVAAPSSKFRRIEM
jgi:hypothetical protein